MLKMNSSGEKPTYSTLRTLAVKRVYDELTGSPLLIQILTTSTDSDWYMGENLSFETATLLQT